MLYEPVRERILKKGYRVKYVPVYYDPSGKHVFEDEATVEEIAIVEVLGTEPSRSERERAIKKLIDTLFGKLPIQDWTKLTDAIKAMALEADLKLQVGISLAEKLVADEFYHEFPKAEYVVSFLVESGLKDAIVPLTSLMAFETSWDHKEAEDFVYDLARETLRKYVADNPDFQYEAARAARELHTQLSGQRLKGEYYRDLVKTWACEVLVGLANSTSEKRDWAREQLKELQCSAAAAES